MTTSSNDKRVSELVAAPSEWDSLAARAKHEDEAQHAAKQTQAASSARSARAKRRRTLAGLLVPALVLAGTTFGLHRLMSTPGPSAAGLDQGRRALLALINSSLEDHLRLHGGYPDDLVQVMPLQVEVAYQRTPGGYELTVQLSNGQHLKVKKP